MKPSIRGRRSPSPNFFAAVYLKVYLMKREGRSALTELCRHSCLHTSNDRALFVWLAIEAVYVKNADNNVMACKFLKIGRYKTLT